MTTKEQERKALEQIKKIVNGLGENSYIGTAMAGMIEDAEENIENDFAMSWKDRAETATRRFEKAEAEMVKLSQDKEMAKKELELAQQTMQQEAERANAAWAQVKERDEKIGGLRIANEALQQLEDEKAEKIAELEMEIIKLKARLFDLMDK